VRPPRDAGELRAWREAGAWVDLYAMSKSTRFVLANSTFSWWAAFLARCRRAPRPGGEASGAGDLTPRRTQGAGLARPPPPPRTADELARPSAETRKRAGDGGPRGRRVPALGPIIAPAEQFGRSGPRDFRPERFWRREYVLIRDAVENGA
jgi:hypothetical protein